MKRHSVYLKSSHLKRERSQIQFFFSKTSDNFRVFILIIIIIFYLFIENSEDESIIWEEWPVKCISISLNDLENYRIIKIGKVY